MSEIQTNEELIAAAAAAKEAKALEAAERKAQRDAERAAKKQETEAEKAEAKLARETAKAAKAQAKLDAQASREAEKAAKAQAKIDLKAQREATRQPEQNGVRRPGPDGKCGRVWALADHLSAALGHAVPISSLLEAGKAEELNESNVRTEYARWKKFHGLTGRIVAPAVAE